MDAESPGFFVGLDSFVLPGVEQSVVANGPDSFMLRHATIVP